MLDPVPAEKSVLIGAVDPADATSAVAMDRHSQRAKRKVSDDLLRRSVVGLRDLVDSTVSDIRMAANQQRRDECRS